MPSISVEWAGLIVTLLTAIVAAAWSVWRFTEDRKAVRARERDRLAGLYVNPFLVACEDLQSRLYNILVLGGLDALKGEDREGKHHPAETLYLIAQYFGWERRVLRYGPYTRDPTVTRLVLGIRATFAKDCDPSDPASDPAGAFCFFRIRQESLGRVAVQRVDSSSEPEFESVGSFAFQKAVKDPAWTKFSSVQKTLAALDNTWTVDQLPGRWRLAEVQNSLVALLNYIEGKEGFKLYYKKRKTAQRDPGWIGWAKDHGWSL